MRFSRRGSVGALAGAALATATPALTCRRAAVHPLGSSPPVREQNTRQERVYCIPIGCSARSNKENHAEVAPPSPAKNKPSAARTTPSTRARHPRPARCPTGHHLFGPAGRSDTSSNSTDRRAPRACGSWLGGPPGSPHRHTFPTPPPPRRPTPRHFAASAAL